MLPRFQSRVYMSWVWWLLMFHEIRTVADCLGLMNSGGLDTTVNSDESTAHI
jgi:hypothetical protein